MFIYPHAHTHKVLSSVQFLTSFLIKKKLYYNEFANKTHTQLTIYLPLDTDCILFLPWLLPSIFNVGLWLSGPRDMLSELGVSHNLCTGCCRDWQLFCAGHSSAPVSVSFTGSLHTRLQTELASDKMRRKFYLFILIHPLIFFFPKWWFLSVFK